MNPDVDNLQSNGIRVAYVIGTYPLLTTTFIDREILLLRRRGLELEIYSIRRPTGPLSREQRALQSEVTYLLPVAPARLLYAHGYFLLRRPREMLSTLFYLLSRPHPGLKTRMKTALHFAEGVYAAYLLHGKRPQRLHAHFVDRAATVALVAARLLRIPYSATAHANDIYVQPVLLREKIASARFVATCTAYNQAHLEQLLDGKTQDSTAGSKIRRIYHGLDLQQYDPGDSPVREHREQPIRLLAVGQLKEKKGFTHLLGACRRLKDQGYTFSCTIVGDGPLREALQTQIEGKGLTDTVVLYGAVPHREVIDAFRRADVFALPCVQGSDGDRDGIPNVILEAMALQLPVVSTSHSGIPEVIRNGHNGLLAPPGDEKALAEALARLFDCPTLRRELGQRARKTVQERFSVEANVEQLLREFLK